MNRSHDRSQGTYRNHHLLRSNIENTNMGNILSSLSRQGRKLKDRLKGRRHKRDGKGTNVAGERDDLSGSVLRPGPSVAAGGHGAEGSRTITDVPQVRSRDRPPQPEPVPADGSDDNDPRERGANVDEKGVGRGHSRLDSDVGAAVESRPSREVEQVDPSPSDPSIPHSAKPDGTWM